MVYIEGSLQTREWDDQEGNKRKTTEVRARDMVLLGGPPGEGGGGVASALRTVAGGDSPAAAAARSPTTIFRSRSNSVSGQRPVSRIELSTDLNGQHLSKSAFPRRPNQRFHVLKVDLQRSLPLRRQPIGRSRNAPLKRLSRKPRTRVLPAFAHGRSGCRPSSATVPSVR